MKIINRIIETLIKCYILYFILIFIGATIDRLLYIGTIPYLLFTKQSVEDPFNKEFLKEVSELLSYSFWKNNYK